MKDFRILVPCRVLSADHGPGWVILPTEWNSLTVILAAEACILSE